MSHVDAGQLTLDTVTWQNHSEVIDATFLEFVIGAFPPLQSADAAAWEKFINVVAPSYRLPSRHAPRPRADMLPRRHFFGDLLSYLTVLSVPASPHLTDVSDKSRFPAQLEARYP